MKKAGKRRNVRPWEEWYLLAARYYGEHGDLLIPEDYVCPNGEKLGRWIERQRAKYNRVPSISGHLDAGQTEALERIGMVWKLEYRRSWNEWMDVLDRYAQAHGNIDVPHSFVLDGYGLGDWLVKQRLRYAAGELLPEEIGDLEARGVNWSLRTRPRTWEDWFADAAAYHAAHGNLRVPPDYVTAGGNRLGVWITRQRVLYKGRRKGSALSAEQIQRLESIGMVWQPLAARTDAWEQMYRFVSEYRDAHDRLPLWPRNLKAPDGRSMVGWIGTQRRQLADGKLSPGQVEKLSRLGIRPAARAYE